MHKQDYELIARVLRERRAWAAGDDAEMIAVRHTVKLIAEQFASELRATNPRFDRERFIAACMGEDSTDSAGRRVRYSRA